MTIKRAVLIGTLSAIAISLITIGIKSNSFKPKTTTPSTKDRSAIRVDAEDVQPISNKWLFTREINSNSIPVNANFTQSTNVDIYNAGRYGQSYTKANSTRISNYVNTYSTSYIYGYEDNQETILWQMDYRSTYGTWRNNDARIWNFNETPTGNIYTLLNTYATPIYNADVIMITRDIWNSKWNYNGIQQVRKSNLEITSTQLINGALMTESGTIQILLDAGCTKLYINGTDILTTQSDTISITNNDIIIASLGNTTGQYWKTITINYFNTRPEIAPIPIPDIGDKVIEVIPIIPMMFQILTMPFTFITQAFNLTLWEGTPYEFNFSNFILSLIAIATLLFIIKLFTSGFSVIGNYSADHESRALKRSQTNLNKAKTEQIKKESSKPSKKG